MASGFFALFDDVAALMDDVAAMSKVATKKTAGLLGDDLAVNAEKASGFVSSRELPILWAIIKGSFLNKLIILPLAFLLSTFLPGVIVPILMIGGIYLAYGGADKIYDYFFSKDVRKGEISAIEKADEDILGDEKKKIKSAILVDFILSIEIVIIALSTVIGKPLPAQIAVVSFISILATIGVYGIVALIVRMDDFGYALMKNKSSASKKIGLFLVNALPKVIKGLTVIGTIAMLLVAGGIYLHNIPFLHDLFHALPSLLSELIVGAVVGVIALFLMKLLLKIIKR